MASDPAAARMTVDELAQASGLTVRSVRHYQSRGLIPPPEVEGRVGYYGQRHLDGLKLVQEMQARGFNLAAIAHLLEQARTGGDQMLGFTRSVMAPFETETPDIVSRDELAARLGGELSPQQLARAQQLGLAIPISEDTYEVPSPTVLATGERLVALGVTLDAALEATSQLRQHAEQIARTFVQIFMEYIWEPFDAADRPEADWPRVQEALDQLRPVANETVSAIFSQTMTDAVESAIGEWIDREEEKLG